MKSQSLYKSSPRMRLIAWFTLGVYFLVALTLTHLPKVPTALEINNDKTLHLCGYFLYASLAFIAIALTFPRLRWLGIYVWIFLAVFAAGDELTQPMFGRDCDYYDWRADVTGAAAAIVMMSLLRVVFANKSASPIAEA